MTPNFIGATGLPRAGSTLLCQMLAQHPELHCDWHSSPLCNTLQEIHHMVSDEIAPDARRVVCIRRLKQI